MNSKECVIIFPVYKTINNLEIAAFAQALKMTPDYTHVFIAPQSMEFDSSFSHFNNIKTVRFNDSYFQSVAGYNRLMMAKEFYDKFEDYEYMLIHQSDAYLLKPELNYWIKKNYDYIGAPWIKPGKIRLIDFYRSIIKIAPFIFTNKARKRYAVRNNVGNGGLSLRRISTFRHILNNIPEEILNIYLLGNEREHNEDVFWALESKSMCKNFKIPKWQEALLFSFEVYPTWSFKRLKKQLPFGCHAYQRIEPSFWKEYIPSLSEKT